ncbi:hypothetical protein C8R43DRAFT_336293 [Mycena crocata]|nr:hypothetical protein C8R43DRAFT_336293 [Mycena crocata]
MSKPAHPLSLQSERRSSLELNTFSTMFQQWDLTSDEASSSSRRGSHQSDGPNAPVGNMAANVRDFDNSLSAPHARQRTSQACDKCRDRKTKCSGDHPVCKRCTARGLICHYSGRERVRGPAKARLRNAMSSSSLDVRFAGEMHSPIIKQEDLPQSRMYSMEYHTPPQQYQQLVFPDEHRLPYSQPCSPPLDAHPLTRASLPHVPHLEQFHSGYAVPPHLQQHYVRRVQSHSALGSNDVQGPMHRMQPFVSRPTSNPAVQGSPAMSRLRTSVVESDVRMTNKGHRYDHQDDGGSSGSSEPPSATDSVFNIENISHSSASSESAHLSEPLSRSASELDLRMMNQIPPYRQQRLSLFDMHGKAGHSNQVPASRISFGHSPATSIDSLNSITPHGPHDVSVPQINGEFGNPWADEGRVIVREVELMYPSPVTPISLGSEAIDMMMMMSRRGFYDYSADHKASPVRNHDPKDERSHSSRASELPNSPLTQGASVH